MNATITPAQSENRNAGLSDLAAMLKDQHARKIDVIAPASQIGARGGDIVLAGVDPQISDEGVTMADGTYRPTAVFDEGIADKLGIPVKYVRRMRNDRPDLYDANVNGWLHGKKAKTRLVNGEQQVIAAGLPGDERSFLVRGFKPTDGDDKGIARAFLSDRYRIVDHLDALTAAMEGVQAAGVDVDVDGCDLTERRMTVRIKAPAVQALAPVLLDGYRSPFSGDSGSENPTVFAGLQISNSETGGGAFTIVPRLIVQVCNNGMTITKDAIRDVHLGGQMEDGVIRWSDSTQQKNLELIKAKTVDAVRTFLDVDYMTKVIRAAEEKAGQPVEKADEHIRQVGKRLRFTEAETDAVLDHFIRGGQMTSGGVLNAVTSVARTLVDGDQAAEMESKALRVLELA